MKTLKPHVCDANVLLALCDGQHQHHEKVLAWLEAAPRTIAISRFTQIAFLRLLNNPAVMGPAALDGRGAWQVWERLTSDARFRLHSEPAGIEAKLQSYTFRLDYAHRLWPDAYLAAFAATANLPLITLDKGLRRFAGVDLVLL